MNIILKYNTCIVKLHRHHEHIAHFIFHQIWAFLYGPVLCVSCIYQIHLIPELCPLQHVPFILSRANLIKWPTLYRQRFRLCFLINKANLRNLIAATGLIILFKVDSNRRFSSPCDLEMWWMTSKKTALLLYYIKLCASFQIHRRIETGVTVRKHLIWVKIDDFLSRVTLKFDRWPSPPIGHLFYAPSSFVHHNIAIDEVKLELQSGKLKLGFDLWPWPLTSDLDFFYGPHIGQW